MHSIHFNFLNRNRIFWAIISNLFKYRYIIESQSASRRKVYCYKFILKKRKYIEMMHIQYKQIELIVHIIYTEKEYVVNRFFFKKFEKLKKRT